MFRFCNTLRRYHHLLDPTRRSGVKISSVTHFLQCPRKALSSSAEGKHTKQEAASISSVVNDRLSTISKLLSDVHGLADWETLRNNITELENSLQNGSIWTNDATNALRLQSRLNYLLKQISTYQDIKDTASEMKELAALATEDLDSLMQEELVPELDALAARIEHYLVSLWLSDPTDANSAYIAIHAGSGGTEACDWAAMLARMYTRWGQSRNFSVEVVEESPGDIAGVKSTTLFISGLYAYGYAQYESGIHRLVRISPFDQARARHTSFASVRVSPHFEEDSDITGIELNPSDLKITTMRSQGAGGQHVNKTESAVRVVHIPSGLAVACQQERSQHRNRTLALSLLKSKLYDIELQKKAQSKADAHSVLPDNAWGSQIRSYVLQPYQLIKDARTGHDVGAGGVQRVLDGDLDEFMEANLRKYKRKKDA